MLGRESAETVRGGILCDEMGLGKTIQVMGLLKNGSQKHGEMSVLIAPVAVLEQWKKVAWRSGFTVKVPSKSGMSWQLDGKMRSIFAPHICCIGFEAAVSKPWLLTNYDWSRLVIDEAHRIASGNTGTELAFKIRADKKWLLTGTPIVNKVKDITTLLKIIGVENPSSQLSELRATLKTYVLARTMEQMRASIPDAPLPPIHEIRHLDFLTKEEEVFYHSKADIIANQLNNLAGASAALQRLKLLMRLRQVSLHPQIYNEARKAQLRSAWTQPDWEGTSTKFEAIRELVAGAKESHKWIIFCHFKHEMEMLERMLKAVSAVEIVQQYNGGLTAAQKEDVLERTHMRVAEDKQEILLVQLQSGGTGLNLQHFDRIIFTGPWWTQALMQQAVGRAVRIGQKKQIVVYHLHLKAEEEDSINIDTFMSVKAEGKGDLCRSVLGAATTTIASEELSNNL
jgi:SNF2 family DNA or RNA helicase